MAVMRDGDVAVGSDGQGLPARRLFHLNRLTRAGVYDLNLLVHGWI